MVLFTLADLYHKITSQSWTGSLHFYPTDLAFDGHGLAQFGDNLDAKTTFDFGDRVLVTDQPTPETVSTILWLWSKGAVVVPVRYTMTDEATNIIAQDCNARLLIKNGDITSCAGFDRQTQTFECHSPQRVSGADLALLIYTSGSTGKPKGIMLSHANVVTALYSIGNYLELNSQEHILGLSPLSFDYGLYQVLFSIAFDCQLTLFCEDFHPIKVIKAIETRQITLLPVVPAMASSLSKIIKVFKKPLPSLIKLTNTGGHLGEETISLLTNFLPQLQVFAMYGLTECKRALYLPPQDSLRKLGSVGIPMPGLEAKIFVESGGRYKEVQQGEIGELFIRSATLMQGYYGNSNAGASIISGNYRDDNWLATGDLFCQDEEDYFFFKGRSKDLIKQAGFCLYPAELEAQIELHPQIHLAGVVPHVDKFGDEIACLHVQLTQNCEETQKSVISWLKENIDSNYRPRETRFIEQMALTPNSKIDKQRLIAGL
jgi:long-chain acyl-CoA synthetase